MVVKTRRPPVSLAPSKTGRPRKLQPDDRTLKMMESLGRLHATTKECAAFLDVSEPTYLKFKADYPEVLAAYARGEGQGKLSLRRTQLRLAEKHPAMAIFLGKNLLGQVDRLDHGVELNEPIRFVIERTERSANRRPAEDDEAAA